MAKIINLDEIVGEDIEVTLNGETYRLPPDLPVELYLKLQRIQAQVEAGNADDAEITREMYEEILDLFRYKQPDLESLPLGMTQASNLITLVYGQSADEVQEEAPPPKRPAGTRSTRKPRK